jgi:iron complex outermembrane recepter protein
MSPIHSNGDNIMIRQFGRLTAGVAALSFTVSALAQPAEADDSVDASAETDGPVEDGEIIVTAQKRRQLARDVPIALTAVTGDIIENNNLTDLERLTRFTPGLLVNQQTDSSASFVVRGIEAGNSGAVSEPSISFFLNDIDTSRSRGLSKELFDIDRVEIARGPQGTLFGRGAMVGAISVHTVRPDLMDVGLQAEGQIGNFNLVQLSGIVNLPIVSDKLGVRFAARFRDRDGYVEDLLGGPALNDDRMFAARGSLRWKAADSLTVDLIVDHQADDDSPVLAKATTIASPGGDTSPFTTGAANRGEPPPKRRQTGATLLIEGELSDRLTFNSISGWRIVTYQEFFDPDGTTFPFLEARNFSDDQDILSQEFRFSFNSGSGFRAGFGASYYRDETENELDFIVNEQFLLAGFPRTTAPITRFPVGGGIFLPVTAGVRSNILTKNQRDSFSLYGNVTWDISSRIVLDAGLRYTFDEATVSQANTVSTVDGVRAIALPNGFGNSLGIPFSNTSDFAFFQPRAALTYKVTDRFNAYAGIAKGVRAGFPQISFDAPVGGQPRPTFSDISNEEVLNIEAGVKGRPFQGLYLEANIFTLDYTNFQSLSLDFPPRMVSVGKALSRGLEVSVSGRPTDWLSLFGNYTLLDTEYKDFRDTIGGVVTDLSGNRFRLAPTHAFTVGGDVRVPLGNDWSLFANSNVQFRSSYFFNNDNLPTERQAAFATVDARIGVEAPGGRLRAELYAENLTDNEYLRDVGNAGKLFGVPTAIRANPRFFGVRLMVRN